jgi:hypothetical protein
MLALKDFAAGDDHDNVSDDTASRSIDEMNDGNSPTTVAAYATVLGSELLPATTAPPRENGERGSASRRCA